MVQVADLRGNDFRFCGVGEIKKLVELVRANIAEHPAIALALKEPRRALRRIHPVRPSADSLQHAILKPLAVHNGINPLRRLLRAPHFGELFKRSHTRFVDHEVFSVTHHCDAQRSAISGN